MKKVLWIISVAILLALVGAIVGINVASGKKQTSKPTMPKVTVAKVMVQPVQPVREFGGHVEAVNTVKLKPRVDGYIEAVYFNEGERVEKGQLLFRIDPRPYKAEVSRLEARLTQAGAKRELAEDNAERARKLIDTGAISRKQAQSLATKAARARANVKQVSAALDAARLKLGFTEVRSPIDGRIGKARITPGNLVTSSDVLTTVVTISPVYVDFNVDEHSYLKLLKSGMLNQKKGVATVNMGLADEEGYPHEGKLDYVGNRMHAGTGTIELRATFANREGELTPGLYARIQLPVGKSGPTALIDGRAVATALNSRYVYVLDKDRKIHYQEVELGPLFHGLRVVRDGLERGETIVVSGLQHVRPGMKVKAKRVAMDRRLSDHQRALVHGSDHSDTDENTATRIVLRNGEHNP